MTSAMQACARTLFLFIALTLAGLVAISSANAQLPPEDRTEGNGNTYAVTDSTETGGPTPNTPALTGGTVIAFTDGDDGEFNIPLSFPLTFHGTNFPAATTLRVGANGAVLLDSASGEVFPTNQDLATTNQLPIIAPFWDDLEPRVCGDVRWGTAGLPPNRVQVIEWDNVCDYFSSIDSGGADGYSFQIRLYETTNVIEFHYSDSTATPGNDNSDNARSATIGLGGGPNNPGQNNPYIQYAHNAASTNFALPSFPSSEFAIRFTPCPSTQHTVATAGQLDAAINCYNAQKPSGNHTIDITADIVHPSIPPQINGPAALFVRGDDHVLAGQWDIGNPAVAGRDLIRHAGTGTTFISGLTLTNAENHAVHIEGGTLNLARTTIVANIGDGIQITTGNSELNSVWIQAKDDAIQLDEGSVSVFNSYLESTSGGAGFVGGTGTAGSSWATIVQSEISASTGVVTYEANIAIVNSTLDGRNSSGQGVYAVQDGYIWVTSSTITGFDQGLRVGQSNLDVASSIVVDNGTACEGWGSSTFTVESSFFDDGSCGPDTELLMPANALGDLAPINGCQLPLAGGGCVATRDLGPSNAIGSGDCTDVVTQAFINAFDTGDVEVDQRGVPRTASSCDAGAFESFATAPSCRTNDFGDVPAGAFYDTPTLWAACNGITTGTSPGIFSPSTTVTRAQLATFLWRWAGEPDPSAPNPFVDVPSGAFYETAVTWLAETGVTTGTSPTTFSPQAPITRAQMATFLWRLLGEEPPSEPNPFIDNPAGTFYADAVTWLAETGITTGTTPTTFSPNQRLSRAQAVTFLYRLQRLF